ncbi:MAG: nucleoside triphosphate pyrophosphohydrolase [Acidimicrobiia bacterium]|nr:nucleoside triphosphate pyrophosphohydrolase [Acidimicrobiia bacterium]
MERGLTILNAHDLPDPLVLSTPTIIAQLDHPALVADLSGRLSRIMPEGTTVTVLVGVGTAEQRVDHADVASLDPELASIATTLYIDAKPGGLLGAIHTMARLRRECPWDREQTRETLVPYLFEEAAEFADAVAAVKDDEDWSGIGGVSDELGDVLLQVLFQAVVASERGEFDLDDVAEGLRQKLVRRHPHVFGDVVADSPEQVHANWKEIKESEGSGVSESLLDRVSTHSSALAAAHQVQQVMAEVGFDWTEVGGVRDKLTEELSELESAKGHSEQLDELGDVLFTVVNLARHLDIDPDLALRSAVSRFSARVRLMEESGPLAGLDHAELESRWNQAKRQQ